MILGQNPHYVGNVSTQEEKDALIAKYGNQALRPAVKMSKSLGNVVNPDDVVKAYGADTMRLYIMFIGDFEKVATWSDDAVKGCKRFLDRVWNLADQVTEEEIRMMVDAGSEKGAIDNEEKDMIQNVFEFDDLTIDEICALAPASIILSPGPGRPEQAGRCMEIVEKLGGEIPILGVCLGHQAICAAYGATVTYAKQLMHGKQSETTLDLTSELFQGLPETVPVARYHSLAADEATLPETLKVTARTADGEVMAVEDSEKKIYGVQFHPESILTPQGRQMVENFLKITR